MLVTQIVLKLYLKDLEKLITFFDDLSAGDEAGIVVFAHKLKKNR